jgi:hypothetical protein
MRILFRRLGRVTAAFVLVPLLAGCESGNAASNENAARLAENIGVFVQDLARQALAAYLF